MNSLHLTQRPKIFNDSVRSITTTATTPLQDIGAKHVTKGLGRVTGNAVMVRGQGSWVEFEDGRRLLDFTAGIAVTNLGHCHPKVSKAAADQCYKLIHGQVLSHDIIPFQMTNVSPKSISAAFRTMNPTSSLSRSCSPLCQTHLWTRSFSGIPVLKQLRAL